MQSEQMKTIEWLTLDLDWRERESRKKRLNDLEYHGRKKAAVAVW